MRKYLCAAAAAAFAFSLGSLSTSPAEAFYSKAHCKHYHHIKVRKSKDPVHALLHWTEAAGKRVWHGTQCRWW